MLKIAVKVVVTGHARGRELRPCFNQNAGGSRETANIITRNLQRFGRSCWFCCCWVGKKEVFALEIRIPQFCHDLLATRTGYFHHGEVGVKAPI